MGNSSGGLGIAIAFLALILALSGIILPTSISDYGIYGKVLTGTLLERPSPSIPDRWYYATNTQQLFYDNGVNWVEIPNPKIHSSTHLFGESDHFRHSHIPFETLWFTKNETEISTSSTGYVLLIETSSQPVHNIGALAEILFCHNIRTTVTTTQWCDLEVRFYNVRSGNEYVVATFRKTSRHDQYDTHIFMCYYLFVLAYGDFQDEDNCKLRVYWKTDGNTFYSNERFLMGYDIQRTGAESLYPWYQP